MFPNVTRVNLKTGPKEHSVLISMMEPSEACGVLVCVLPSSLRVYGGGNNWNCC